MRSAYSSGNLILLAFTYLFYFGQFGVFIPYLGVFLDGRGFSSKEIGELFALITFARIAGPNLWAAIADSTGKSLRLLQLGALLTLSMFTLAFWVDGFWYLTISFSLMMMFWTAILPQVEVLTLNCVRANPVRYGYIRLWGSIGYILLTIFTGKMIDIFSSEAPLVVGVVVLSSLFMVTLFLIEPKRDVNTAKDEVSIWRKVRQPVFHGFIASAILLQLSFGPYYGFFALYMRDLGYSGQATGWLVGLGVAAEVLIFLKAGKLINRFGVKWVLLTSILFTSLRWYLLATVAASPIFLVAAQCLHAFSFGLAHAASMHFIHHYFGLKDQSQGQAIYISFAFGIGGAAGGYFSGSLWNQGAGAELSFTLAAISALVAACCLLPICSKRM
ncbi:MFS transporter [Paraglaciecola marina]|uniref:MFS transporter n=1 Tax=Paraglaciecola marina TaxID=2500157 RepID=UPI00105EA4F1|nr:MFS transporter [Paraglaciecola marina]